MTGSLSPLWPTGRHRRVLLWALIAGLTLRYSQWNVTIVTQFVQLDDRVSGSNFLRFARSLWADQRLTGATLSIYEYRHATRADADATLNLGVPLMNGAIAVRLADLVRQ